MRKALLIVAAVAGLSQMLAAREEQASPAAEPAVALEIASVTPNTAGGRGMMGMQPDGRFVATNATLRVLIREAYQLQDFQIIGGPAWMASDRFDVVVKSRGALPGAPAGGVPPVQRMLRAFLADRFKLNARLETREMPTYDLGLARADKSLGPGLKPSTVDCAAMAVRGGGPPQPTPPGERPRCGARGGMGRLTAGAFPMSQLAIALSQAVGRPVIDRTGLTGGFDVDLAWTPDPFRKGVAQAGSPAPPGIDPDGPSLFMALQDQLGLKLDFGKGRPQVLLVEGVEVPAPAADSVRRP